MKRFNIKTLSLIVPLALAIAGCQTTNGFSADSNAMQLSQAEQAKAELKEAISRQLRSAFLFQTDIKLSNAKRRSALANATPEQLASSGNKMSYCEDTHDNAYVELLRKAEAEGYDVEDRRYDNERAALISNYQVCDKEYDEWYESYYIGDNQEEYMPDYDDKHTAKDAKEAEVHHTFIYEPLDLTVLGSYRPMAGKISLLPSVQFDSRNLFVRLQQPMYIDVKEGVLYLWAENFALLTSELVDERLGTQWKNKWIKIELDDGSLPDDFAKGLFISSLEAMKLAYAQEPVEDFNYLSPEELSQSLPYLEAEQYQLMTPSTAIVSRVQTQKTHEYQTYLTQKNLLELVKAEYPEIFVVDGEAAKSVNSRNLIRSLMEHLEESVDNYEYQLHLEDTDEADSTDDRVFSRQHFGLNRGKLTWMQTRYELENKKIPNEGMMIDVLTRFNGNESRLFGSLPAGMQTPTDANSINARDYMKHLVEHYDAGNGTTLGKLFFQGFMYGWRQEMEKANYRNQMTKIASAETIADKYDTKPQNSSSIVVNTRDDIDVNDEDGFESAQCVLISISFDMMCSESDIDINDPEAVQSCAQEKVELIEAYNDYCQ